MTYEIQFTDSAQKAFSKLEGDVQDRILSVLDRIRIRPFAHLKKLIGSHFFRLRVGDYRIIIDVKQEVLVILIVDIDHRKRVYKNLQ